MNNLLLTPVLTTPIHSSLEYTPKTSMPSAHDSSSFIHWLKSEAIATNDKLNAADTALNELAMGKATHLHQTMLCFEEAKLSFHYLEQIRNRLMSAYQELLREQI